MKKTKKKDSIIDKIKQYIKKNNIKKKLLSFYKKNNKIIIISVSILIIISVLTVMNLISSKQEVQMDKIIDKRNYTNVKKSNKTISEVYGLEDYKIYETNKIVVLGNLKGKILFLRNKEMNANIYQAKVKIEAKKQAEGDPLLVQVDKNMQELKDEFYKYAGINYNTLPNTEKLNSKSKDEIPLTEEIYIEKRNYCATYIVDNGEKYDINYYMDDDYLVLELVKFLDNK